METIRLKNGSLVTQKGVKKGDCLLQDGHIKLPAAKTKGEKTIDIRGKYVLPGFVDIHFHGCNLFDFTLGKFNPDNNTFDAGPSAYRTGLDMLRKTLPAFGVTSFYVATFAAAMQTLKNAYNCLTEYLKNDQTGGAKLLGGNLEGSFISPDMAGAQNPDYVFKPSNESFDQIEDRGSIKIALVGPDSGEPAIALTKYLTDKGILVGAGHTNATCRQFLDAVNAGTKYCVHFTNGPTGGSYKPFNGGGAVEAVLTADSIYAELIADGYHVNPLYIRDIIKRKGFDKIIGMTDCMFVAGSSVKRINLSGVPGKVSDDGRYIAVENKKNTLFGSVLTVNKGFENMLNWLTSDMTGIWNKKHPALDFKKALVAVAKFYSTNPCKITGLADKGLGRIENNANADITILNITGSPGNYNVNVEYTFVDGNVVYQK